MQITQKNVFVLKLKADDDEITRDYTLSEHDLVQLKNHLMPSDDWRVSALRGMKIDAIKRVREHTGAGLKEAKDMVERFCAASASGAAHDEMARQRQLDTTARKHMNPQGYGRSEDPPF